MSKQKLFKGFVNEDSYKLYRFETQSVSGMLKYIKQEEERKQTPYWLINHYIDLERDARKMLGYIECLWDFDIIDEDTFDKLTNAYAMIGREAEDRVNELYEEL